jgi:hypothetical protein
MIEEYYYKPNLVPPFSFLVYVYWIFWKLTDMCQQSKKVSPTDSNTSNISTNKNKLNGDREHNLISNWTNGLIFYG